MTRCQHCNKLTHTEDLNVYVSVNDMDKIKEFTSYTAWSPAYLHTPKDPREFGYLKVGDIRIHFIVEKNEIIDKLKTI